MRVLSFEWRSRMIELWILSGWSGLLYIAIREKWSGSLAGLIGVLLLLPTALIGPITWGIAFIFVPTDKFLDRRS
jgi:hypothetical protein